MMYLTARSKGFQRDWFTLSYTFDNSLKAIAMSGLKHFNCSWSFRPSSSPFILTIPLPGLSGVLKGLLLSISVAKNCLNFRIKYV